MKLATAAALAVCFSLAACASASTIPLAKNMVKITARAAPACGSSGAEKVAVRMAAVETIRRGYERFMITGAQYQNTMRVVGYTPVTANTTGSATANTFGSSTSIYGSSRTTYSGGVPIAAGGHRQGLVVRMFNPGEPGFEQALSAKETLGPKWQEAVNSKKRTCF